MQKLVIKTDISEMKKAFQEARFEVDGNKVTIPVENEQDKVEYLERALQILEPIKGDVEEIETLSEEEIISDSYKDSMSKVDFYEKIIQNKNGEDVLVRLSVVKQNVQDNPFERLVNVTYISKQTGMVTSNQVFGYEDGHQFDQDVLPEIMDGFMRNVVLSGREVTVNEVNPTKCYLTAGENDDCIFLEGYYVDNVRSLLDYSRDNNLFGDKEGQVNLSELERENVVSSVESSETFEEQVTDTREQEIEGPKLTKTLGEMPSSRAAFSNWMNLLFFLVVDVVAIFVGIYFLIS